MLTYQQMIRSLKFNPETGEIFRIDRQRTGQDGRAGTISVKGYRCIYVNGKVYRAHRLMWYFCYRRFPKMEMDHINCNKLDNRICNLRLASTSQSQMNRPLQKNNSSGYKGVSFHRRIKKWQARIGVDKKRIHLGYYGSAKKASVAYCLMLPKYHGEFARVS